MPADGTLVFNADTARTWEAALAKLRVDPATFVNSGSLGSLTNPLSGAQVYDLELAGNYGPLFAQGEYFHYSVDREGLPTASFDGGYGLIAYTLTGESHKYVPGTASYARIVPAHAFSPAEGFWGAWEVAGRVSYIDMTSNSSLPNVAV